MARFTYNWILDASRAQKIITGSYPKLSELKKYWNAVKPEWVYESPKDANQQVFTNYGKALANIKKTKAGFPARKKRGDRDSFYVSNDKLDCKNNKVRLPRIGWVRMTEPLRLKGRILSATVSRRADRYYISFSVEGTFAKPRVADGEVGIDLGICTALVASNGYRAQAPKPLAAALKTLARRQRCTSRRVLGSKNRAKANITVARLHQKVANIRKDFWDKETTRLCRENQTICTEDLNVSGMTRNRTLARALADVGMGMVGPMLAYKAKLYGCEVVQVGRWFPSSQLCSECGARNRDLRLGDREYSCGECGTVIDRDLNAARNILTEGRRLSKVNGTEGYSGTKGKELAPKACGQGVRRKGAKRSDATLVERQAAEAGTHSDPL